MHLICIPYAGRMPAPQLFFIFGLYDLAAHQLTSSSFFNFIFKMNILINETLRKILGEFFCDA
jgi:hypothetical protein